MTKTNNRTTTNYLISWDLDLVGIFLFATKYKKILDILGGRMPCWWASVTEQTHWDWAGVDQCWGRLLSAKSWEGQHKSRIGIRDSDSANNEIPQLVIPTYILLLEELKTVAQKGAVEEGCSAVAQHLGMWEEVAVRLLVYVNWSGNDGIKMMMINITLTMVMTNRVDAA